MTNKNNPDENSISNQSKDLPPPISKEISTFRKLSMDYFTADGVTLRTGFSDIVYWYLLCIRELLDNSVDFLINNYRGCDDTVITVEIFKDDKIFYLKVKNSNYNNLQVFENKTAIFNPEQRYGSK